MDIDLGQDIEFVVKYNGTEYKLREPSVKEVSFLKEKSPDDQDAVLEFLSLLGLPVSISENMPVTKLKKLVDSMVGVLSEKK